MRGRERGYQEYCHCCCCCCCCCCCSATGLLCHTTLATPLSTEWAGPSPRPPVQAVCHLAPPIPPATRPHGGGGRRRHEGTGRGQKWVGLVGESPPCSPLQPPSRPKVAPRPAQWQQHSRKSSPGAPPTSIPASRYVGVATEEVWSIREIHSMYVGCNRLY